MFPLRLKVKFLLRLMQFLLRLDLLKKSLEMFVVLQLTVQWQESINGQHPPQLWLQFQDHLGQPNLFLRKVTLEDHQPMGQLLEYINGTYLHQPQHHFLGLIQVWVNKW